MAESHTTSMDDLKIYFAIIQSKDSGLFHEILNRISSGSSVRPNRRFEFMSLIGYEMAYKVMLSEDEAIVVQLACPGRYEPYRKEKHGLCLGEL